MAGRLYRTYLILLIASLLAIGHVHTQQTLSGFWFISACSMWFAGQRMGIPLRQSVASAIWFILPGMTLTVLSVMSAFTECFGQWANGFMEFWFHPFVLLLELLPFRRLGAFSEVYLATCVVPFVIILCSVLSWTLARMLRGEESA